MKIGILTYHRAYNYGAMLQAYALRQILLKYSDDVSFVSYNPTYIDDDYASVIHRKPFILCGKRSKLTYPIYLLRYFNLKYKENLRNKMFSQFATEYLPEESMSAKYDLLVYGSDQIWCKQYAKSCPGYDAFYFSNNNISSERSIVYAASMGSIEAEPSDYDFLKTNLNRYYSISVREESLKFFLAKLTGKNIDVTLDPTLLLTKTQWELLIPSNPLIKEKYILCYNILEDSDVDKYARRFAKQKKMRLINLVPRVYNTNYTSNDFICAGPLEFLCLIRDAEFVISSSFHGVAFSIIFQKQFLAKLQYKSERVSNLLKQLGISEVLVDNVDSVTIPYINYLDIIDKLQNLRDYSLSYINKNMQ